MPMTTSASNECPVFKSGDIKTFARAAMALKSRGVAFRIAETYEGPEPVLRTQWLFVSSADAEVACDAVRDIPSEILFPPTVSEADSAAARFATIVQLVTLAVIILLAVVAAFMNR